jgi:hypothetical protein
MAAYLQQVIEQVQRFLGYEAVPWLLLLGLLVIRPPALGKLLRLRKTQHAGRYRHLLHLTRFRMALVQRDSTKSGHADDTGGRRLP